MVNITLTPLFHKDTQLIAINFKFDNDVKDYIRSIEGIKWSETHKTFYIEHTAINK